MRVSPLYDGVAMVRHAFNFVLATGLWISRLIEYMFVTSTYEPFFPIFVIKAVFKKLVACHILVEIHFFYV